MKTNQIKTEVLNPKKIRGKTIPIDIMGIMYQSRWAPRNIIVAKMDPFSETIDELAVDCLWFKHVINKILQWWDNFKIFPLFVYDGTPRPLKAATLKNRRAKQNKDNEKIQTLLTTHANTRNLLIPEEDRQQLKKLLARYNLVPRESAERFKKFFQDLGIPTLTVDGDAERYCSLYSLENNVPVMSKDGDCFAHGASSVIVEEDVFREKGSQYTESTFSVIRTSSILAKAGLEYDSFVDVCIMAGTDYNNNVKNYSFIKVLKFIQDYDYIENIPASKNYNAELLNYVQVRKEFEQVPSDTLIESGSLKTNYDNVDLDKVLKEYGLSAYFDDIVASKLKIQKLE